MNVGVPQRCGQFLGLQPVIRRVSKPWGRTPGDLLASSGSDELRDGIGNAGRERQAGIGIGRHIRALVVG